MEWFCFCFKLKKDNRYFSQPYPNAICISIVYKVLNEPKKVSGEFIVQK